MNFKKLALVSLASAAVLGAAQTAVHADDANTNTTATSDAVKAAQAKVDAAKAKIDAAQTAVANAQKSLDEANANLEQVTSSTNPQAQAWKADADRRVATAKAALESAQKDVDAAFAEYTTALNELEAAQKTPEETVTVKVRVADLDGNPVAGAKVEFSTDGFSSGHQVETGADGFATYTVAKGTQVSARLASWDESNYDYKDQTVDLLADDSANNNVALIELTKKASTTPATPVTPETPAAKDAKLTITVVSDGQAREGVAVDVMVNGKVVNVGTTDAKGQVVVNAKEGDKVDYRVASVPAGYEAPQAASSTLKAGDNAAQITVNKAGSTTDNTKPVETPAAKDATLLITVVSDGQVREGVAVDVMVNGKVVNVGTTDAKGQVVVNAKEGDKVDYRVASVPAGYEAPAAASATLKAGENTAQITVNKAGSTTDNTKPVETPAAKDATLLITVVSDGQAREGVAVDVMVNGKVVNVGTTDAKGQVVVNAKEGDKVDYRVASVPAGYEAPAPGSATLKAGENTAQITVNKAGSTTDDNKTPETPAAKDATLLITVVSDGQAREGVAVDVMVNGKVVNVGTTDAKGQVVVNAKEGDKVDYRVATAPVGYVAPAPGSATLKAGENTAQITVNKAGSTTPTPEPIPTPTPTEEATFTLSVVDSASKAPLSGVAIDLMVAGKVTTATTDAKGQVAVSAKAGDVVKYRVAVTPAGYKSNTVAYDATLVKGENAATLALEAEGTTPTPQPQPEPKPTEDKENTTNARFASYAYEDVNKDGKYYDRFRAVKTYEDVFGNYNYSYVMAMENKKK